MPLSDTMQERIHKLWDELADYHAASVDDALHYLMGTLCALVNAQNVCWIGAVRLPGNFPSDPVKGWRPHTVRHLQPSRPLDASTREQVKKLEQGTVDETTVRNVAEAGTFRVNRLVDLVAEEWFDSPYYHCHYRGVGHADAIWAGIPISLDAETYFGIFRDAAQPDFSVEDRETFGYALRGLKWFHRQQMLNHGLLVANSPLTPVERQVLHLLLTGLPEKLIAAELDRSYHTTHEYVSSIFRKFGVNNRAALMALWLGKAS